ncbi:MAG: hypothetical protein QOD98_1717 [Nocardioidaceae bacterium]|nr:hypothetical protein [Nocardioidaceae bacterium]
MNSTLWPRWGALATAGCPRPRDGEGRGVRQAAGSIGGCRRGALCRRKSDLCPGGVLVNLLVEVVAGGEAGEQIPQLCGLRLRERG